MVPTDAPRVGKVNAVSIAINASTLDNSGKGKRRRFTMLKCSCSYWYVGYITLHSVKHRALTRNPPYQRRSERDQRGQSCAQHRRRSSSRQTRRRRWL